MTHSTASAIAILLASSPGAATAQVDCEAMPKGPARTDCYLGLSQFYRAQSDLAAARARAQSGAAWYRAVTGTDPPKHRTTSSEIKFATLHRSANGRSGPLVLEDNGAIRFFDVQSCV